MILNIFLSHLWLTFLSLCLAPLVHSFYQYLNSPLRAQQVPGPWLARMSHLYRFYCVIRRTWHRDLIQLHRTYGPIVWIAPNEVSVSDPKYRDVIYSFASKDQEKFFRKAEMFETGNINDDFSFLFEQEPKKARLGKKTLAHIYSEAGLREFEGEFDKSVDELIEGIRRHHVKTGKPANFYHWMHYYMHDLVTYLATNDSSGLCLAGSDIGRPVLGLRIVMDVVGTLFAIPLTLSITTRAIRKWLLTTQLEWVYNGPLRYVSAGVKAGSKQAAKWEKIESIRRRSPRHLLERFYQAQVMMRQNHETGNPIEGVTNNLFNLIAGGVGVTPNIICVAITNIFRNRSLLNSIRTELSTLPTSPSTMPISTFFPFDNPSKTIPTLQATIKESLRVCPAVGFVLSRAVPPCGVNIEGYHIPQGFNIGMSGWPVHHDPAYFGEDADSFRPDRWLDNSTHPTEVDREGNPVLNRKRMEQAWLPFGAGARICIGRHLAANALVKGIARLVEEFDIKILTPPQESFGFVVEHVGMMVRFDERKKGDMVKPEVVKASA